MVDYIFYTGIYKGNAIPKTQFDRLAIRADSQIVQYEQVLTVTYFDTAKGRDMAVCAVAEEIYKTEATTQQNEVVGVVVQGGLKSISTGSVSASFDGLNAADAQKTAKQRYMDALALYAHVYHGGDWLQ